MALKNRSMYAILGILSLSPGTGYDIKKYSDRVLRYFWHENFGHIYPTLKKLREAGLIEAADSDARDRKTVYRITDAGRRAFRVWLGEDTLRQPVRSEFMLKLLFSSDLPGGEILAALARHRAEQEERLRAYAAIEESLRRGIPEITPERAVFLRAVLRSGILAGEASMRWCDETMEEIRKIKA